MKSILITCAVLLLACAQAWSQYSYCFPYGKGEFQEVAFVNRDTGMAIGKLMLRKDSTFYPVSVVLRTTNSGATWDTTALPPTPGKKKFDAVIDYDSRVVLHRNGTAMIFSREATYTTGDFGRTWDVLPYYSQSYPGSLFYRSKATYFEPQLFDDSLVYANVGYRSILRSTDLGRTWMEIILPDSSINGPFLMSFASATHGWISDRELWETTDGCATFHRRPSSYKGWIQSLNDSVLVGYYGSGLCFSKDSGTTWTNQSINRMHQLCSALVIVDMNRLCFGQDYEFVASQDRGKSIHITPLDPFDQVNAMCIADSLTYFAAMWHGIIRITNGGFPDSTTSVQNPDVSPPFTWTIAPNPSSEDAHVRFSLDAPANVCLRVTTVDGRLVLERKLGVVQPGAYAEHISLPSGSYTCTLTIGKHSQTTPISIIR